MSVVTSVRIFEGDDELLSGGFPYVPRVGETIRIITGFDASAIAASYRVVGVSYTMQGGDNMHAPQQHVFVIVRQESSISRLGKAPPTEDELVDLVNQRFDKLRRVEIKPE